MIDTQRERCQSVKALHHRREEIKQRMREKQRQRQRVYRQQCLGNVRDHHGAPATSSYTTPCVEDWASLEEEIGFNIQEAEVMGYLLAIEEEIRQEQHVAQYEQCYESNGDWEEYLRTLMS